MNQEELKINRLERQVKNLKKSLVSTAIVSIIASTCLGAGIGYLIGEKKSGLSSEMREFLDFYEFFKTNYYEQVDDRTLLDGLYYGLTESVNDDYTFYTSTVNNEYQDFSSSGVGLGIERSVYYGQALITQVMRGSPADKAEFYDLHGNKLDIVGLKKGDIIESADVPELSSLYNFKDYHYSDWNNVLVGEKGSTLTVIVNRNDIKYRVKMVRGHFNVDKVQLISHSDGEAIFKIDSLLGSDNESKPAEELDSYFKEVIFKDKDYKLKNLIIDLRDNGGGYVSNCNQLLGLFLGSGKISGYYQYADNSYQALYTSTINLSKSYNDKIEHYTFIINQNTASAAETFVITMQDSEETKNKITVVGENSLGKGVAQRLKDVNGDGSEVRYTFAKVCSPEKRTINKRGIIPDVYSSYLSIQDRDEYDTWRLHVNNVDDNSKLSLKEQALVKSRIELLLNTTTADLTDAINKFQKVYNIEENGLFGEKTASKLGDLFYDYYMDNTPVNIYDSFVIGKGTYDSYYPVQMKCVKDQIELILNKEYKTFDLAVRAFQDTYGLLNKDGLYDLETSYLLQGMMYDLCVEKENSVIEEAKGVYGI